MENPPAAEPLAPSGIVLLPGELVRLGRFLEAHHDRFALALVRIPTVQRRELTRWVANFCEERHRSVLNLDGSKLNAMEVWHRIERNRPAGGVMFLDGLDEAFLDPAGELLSLLNRQRERIAQVLRGPVLLMLGESAMNRFQAASPDLADWHAAAFEFPSAERASLELASMESWSTPALSRELADSRIALLESQAKSATDPSTQARIWDEIARLHRYLGRYSEAEKLYRLALESAVRQFGPDHPTVAVRRSNLATILRDLGEHQQARQQIELALESELRQFGPDHPNVAVSRSNLANILGDLGEHQQARHQIELALESELRQFGPDHPTVAVSRSNLAIILRDLGEHQQARQQIELALESALRQFGPDHPTVAVSRSNLANILHALGEYRQALREIDQALDVLRKKLPSGHPHIQSAAAFREILIRLIGK